MASVGDSCSVRAQHIVGECRSGLGEGAALQELWEVFSDIDPGMDKIKVFVQPIHNSNMYWPTYHRVYQHCHFNGHREGHSG